MILNPQHSHTERERESIALIAVNHYRKGKKTAK
jgi:hypothetical protein